MNRNYLVVTLTYAALLVYASLFPFHGWRLPEEDVLAWFALRLPHHISKSDVLVNVIAYVPFGFLVTRLFWKRGAGLAPSCLAAGLGMGLSFAMELLQTCLPGRVASIIDFLTNSVGTVSGSLLALFWHSSWSPEGELGKWRARHIAPGPLADIGLIVVLCWALSQLAPFVPSVDWGGIKTAVKPLWQTAHHWSLFRIPDAATYCLYLTALGVVAQVSTREGSRPLPFFALFAAAVLFAKIFVLGRQISLEALSGLLAAAVLWALTARLSRSFRLSLGMLLLVAGFAVYELKAGVSAGVSQSFNWVPFAGQMAKELTGFESILEGFWPFAALSCLFLMRFGNGRGITLLGTLFVLIFVFILEWLQLFIHGRTADVTQVLLAQAGWLAPLLYLQSSKKQQMQHTFAPQRQGESECEGN